MRFSPLKIIRFAFAALVVLGFQCFNARADAGTITFGNSSSCKVINSQTGNPVTAANGIKAALYWSPAGSTNFVQIGDVANVGVPVDGIFADGTRTTGPETSGGDSALFRVRAWGGGFTTYEQALQSPGTLIGQSTVVQGVTGNPAGDPPTPPRSLVAASLQSFTLSTNIPMTLICPTNKVVECGSAWNFDVPSVSGGCADSRTVVVLNTITNGNCPQTFSRTWLATDACGSSNVCHQTVTVVDLTPPVLVCAGNKAVECGSVWAFDPPQASDVCSGTNVTLTILATLADGPCPQTLKRIWLATDACGNTNTCAQSVTVMDTTPPAIVCVSNKTVSCSSAWIFDPPEVSDVCSGTNVTLTILGTTTNGSCPEIVTRGWLALDLCGNSNTCSQTITIAPITSLACGTNRIVTCDTEWVFDPSPVASAGCAANILVSDLGTVTNGFCPRTMSQAWGISNVCDGSFTVCTQSVTVVCPDCTVLLISASGPPHPVPPGGIFAFSGTVTNVGDLLLTNVVVLNDHPNSQTLVFGPAILNPGEGAVFTGSHTVPVSYESYVDTLFASGITPVGMVFSNSATASATVASVVIPGDSNGDGVVDQVELNAVLSNYWSHSAWIQMTNPACVSDGGFEFALTNITGWNFTVLASTNLVDWTVLTEPAYPVYKFTDHEATNLPARAYRLRWP